MSWLASLFGGNKRAAGRSNALSSTRDAFSMPSPVLSPQQEAYEPESSSSYTYPPQQNGQAYGYVPTARRGSSLLPTHNASGNNGGYPPLAATWTRLKTWLANEYPELGDTLNYAILPQDLQELEAHFGFALPPAVRESYLVADGQEPESSAACSEGLFFGLHLLPLEEVYDEWRFWRDVDGDPDTAGHDRLRAAQQSIPPGWVRREYSNRGWLPLISDKAGNYIGVDLNPDERGATGQVIVFGRDFDTKVVLANGDGPGGWARWLSAFADMLEGADGFELISGDTDSQGSEDDIGYQSYFDTGGESADQHGPKGWALTGEYRGWPALEAFADRGVRRWMEAGLVPEFSAQEKGKGPEDGSAVLDLAKATADTDDANGTLSVYAKPENAESPEDLQPQGAARAIPAISVTKPPAPRPVLLPTENDILASPSNFDAPSPADVEGGFAVPMAQYQYDPPPSAASPTTTAKETPNTESSMFVPPAPAAAPLSDITDLLTESGPALETAALEPAPSAPNSGHASPVATPSPVADLLSGDEAAAPTPEKSEEGDEEEEDDEDEEDEDEDEEDEEEDDLVEEGGANPALAADDANAKTASP